MIRPTGRIQSFAEVSFESKRPIISSLIGEIVSEASALFQQASTAGLFAFHSTKGVCGFGSAYDPPCN